MLKVWDWIQKKLFVNSFEKKDCQIHIEKIKYIFYFRIFFNLYERTRRGGHENLRLRSRNPTLDFEKIPEGQKNGPKTAKLFLFFLTT